MGQTAENKRVIRAKSSRTDTTKYIRQKEQIKTILEALLTNREKEIKEDFRYKILYTRKYRTRSKETPEERNCTYCNAPNWNRNHKCLARESLRHDCKIGYFGKVCRWELWKQQEIKDSAEPDETENRDIDKSIKTLAKIKHENDRKNNFTMIVKHDGTKNFVAGNGSPVTKNPSADVKYSKTGKFRR